MTIKAVWITCPKWFSSVIYIAMGWICLAVFGQLWNTLPQSCIYLAAGRRTDLYNRSYHLFVKAFYL